MKSVKKHKEKVLAIELKNFDLKKIILLILTVILIVEVLVTFNINTTIFNKLRPSNLELIRVVDSSCSDCLNTDTISSKIQDQNVKILSDKTFDRNSAEVQKLITKYGIMRLPVLLIFGEINRDQDLKNFLAQLGGVMKQDTVYIETEPPYLDLSTGNIRGRISLTNLVDSSCELCSSLGGFVNTLKNNGVRIVDEKTLEYTTVEAREFINKFSVQKIPAVILSNDITEYKFVQSFWSQLNTTEKSGFYALHTTIPPYRNVSTNKIDGLVTLFLVTDDSCANCYNVSTHKQILLTFGIRPKSESIVEISSQTGKNIVSKYNIKKVPTIILSPEASLYSSLVQVWPTVGTTEADGWFVFRSTELMGTYKDLSSGKIVVG